VSCRRHTVAAGVSMALLVRAAPRSADGGPGRTRAQGHHLAAVPVDGGVDLVLTALPAAPEPQPEHPSSLAGCRASTSTGDH
jgi:hypothetical protein